MAYRTTRTDHCKIPIRFAARPRAILSALATWAFSELDTSAARRGWQVRVTRSGLGRVYRDPRFDTWAWPCPEPSGTTPGR